MGDLTVDASGTVLSLVMPNTPALAAGFDQDDVITSVDGKMLSGGATLQSSIAGRRPGDRVTIAYRHPDGKTGTGVVILAEDPEMEAVPIESTGGTVTPEQKAFRAAWLGTKQR